MTTEFSVLSEGIKTIIQIVSIGIGWMVVHKLSESRDRDKARREMLAKAADGLSEEVTRLFSQSITYHTKERDRNDENILKMSLQDMSARTSLLSDISKDAKELGSCRSALLSMKKAITANHFEDEHEESMQLDDPQIQLITSETLRVKHCFLKLKHRQFPAD